MAIIATFIFVASFILIVSERVHRVAAVLIGVAAMTLVGIVNSSTAFFSAETGVDWNVIFLLFGMMIIVSVTKQTGLFEYLAIWAARTSQGRPFKLMVLLMLTTSIISPFLDSVTVLLLVAPVTFLVCQRLGLQPIPFILAEVFAANVSGAATLIGDPPNIMIGIRADLSFTDFLINLAPVVLILIVVLIGLCWLMFRKTFTYDPDRAAEVMSLNPMDQITDMRRAKWCLAVIGLVVVGFVMHAFVHIEPAIVAMLGAGAIVAVNRSTVAEFLEEVEWDTLVFFMGLFILVGGLVEVGIISAVGEWAIELVGDEYLLAAGGLMFSASTIGAIIDTIPFTATMLPIVEQFVETVPDESIGTALWWALALGADLGGNATAVGASANVVAIGVARREGHPISFWHFTKYGIIVTVVTVPLSFLYLWLRYFL